MRLEPEERAEWARRLEAINDEALKGKAKVEVLVIKARSAGCSWQLIADALGVTRQACQERFQKLPELTDESTHAPVH